MKNLQAAEVLVGAPAARTGAEPGAPDVRTRDRVAQLLLERGPATAAVLGTALSLGPAAIRRHLDTLLAEGTITVRTVKPYGARGRGRPAKVFTLTDTGREAFPHSYDDLAVRALRFLAETGGEEAIATFAQARVAEMETRYAAAMIGATTDEQRGAALAAALTDDGYAASSRPSPAGAQVCQHHCPVAHVAHEFPQLCEAETEAFGRLLGRHVQRLATIAHGDGVCTTNLPLQPLTPTPPKDRL